MTKTDLFALIQKAGMIPVPVTIEDAEVESLTRNVFTDDLEHFLTTAKAIGSVAVFIEDTPLEDEDFLYSSDESNSDNESEVSEVDLSTLSSALAKYKKYLGQNYLFRMTAKGGVDDLWFVLYQDWAKDFENEWERAEGKLVVEQFKRTDN